jgi:hypothetical protein
MSNGARKRLELTSTIRLKQINGLVWRLIKRDGPRKYMLIDCQTKENIMSKPETIKIDDIEYVRADSSPLAEEVDGLRYCVVRTYSAGVHIGYVKEFGEKHPQHAKLLNSRRLHSWSGACSLSQVAMDGVSIEESRIAMTVPEIELTDVIEVITCSIKAAKFFKDAKAWKK